MPGASRGGPRPSKDDDLLKKYKSFLPEDYPEKDLLELIKKNKSPDAINEAIDKVLADMDRGAPVNKEGEWTEKTKSQPKKDAKKAAESFHQGGDRNGGRGGRSSTGGRGGAGGRGPGVGSSGSRIAGASSSGSSSNAHEAATSSSSSSSSAAVAPSSSSAPSRPAWGAKDKTPATAAASEQAATRVEPVQQAHPPQPPVSATPNATGVWAATKSFAEVLKQKELEKLAPPPPAAPANQPETAAAAAAADASGDAKKGKRGGGSAGRDGKKAGKKDEPVVVDSTELEKLSLASVGANADAQQSVGQAPAVSVPPSPPRPAASDSSSPQKQVKMGKWAAPAEEEKDTIRFGNFDSTASTFDNWGAGSNLNLSGVGSSSQAQTDGGITASSPWSGGGAADAGGASRPPPGLESSINKNNQRAAPGQSRGSKSDVIQSSSQPMQSAYSSYQPQAMGRTQPVMPTAAYGTMPGYPPAGFEQQFYQGSTPAGAPGAVPNAAPQQQQQQQVQVQQQVQQQPQQQQQVQQQPQQQQPQQVQQPQQQQFAGQQQQFPFNPYFQHQGYYNQPYYTPQMPFYATPQGGRAMYPTAPRAYTGQEGYNVAGGMAYGGADGTMGGYPAQQFADASGYGLPMQGQQGQQQGAQANKNKGPGNGAGPQQGLGDQAHNANVYQQQQGYGAYPNQWASFPQTQGWTMQPIPYAMTQTGAAGQPAGFPQQQQQQQQQQGGRDGNRGYGNRAAGASGWGN